MITLTEVLTQPKQKGNMTLEQEYRDLLLHSRNFTLIPIDSAVAERAADLRARYRFRTPDALQIMVLGLWQIARSLRSLYSSLAALALW